MVPVTSKTDFLARHSEKTVVASSSRRRCRATLCLDGFRLNLSGWRWNQGFPSYFSGGTGGTQAANQAAKWSSFPYLSTFQAGRQHFYIFFLPDRFTYFQHRIPIGSILFAFSRSRPKKFRRHVVVTASDMDLGSAGAEAFIRSSRLRRLLLFLLSPALTIA